MLPKLQRQCNFNSTLTFSSDDQSQVEYEQEWPDYLKGSLVNQAFLTSHLLFFTLIFSWFFSGKLGCKNQSRSKGRGRICWVSWQRGNYFKSAVLIQFEEIYLIFMSVCFESFDVSHDFSKNTAPVRKHVVLTIYQSSYELNQFLKTK